jgi:hypothetical protein
MPRRIPNQLDIGFFNLIERKEFGLDIPRDLPTQVTTGSGQSHLHIDARTLDRDVVNKTKINNIEGNFRVVAIPELVPNLLLRQRRINNRCLRARKVAWASRADGTLGIHVRETTPPRTFAQAGWRRESRTSRPRADPKEWKKRYELF